MFKQGVLFHSIFILGLTLLAFALRIYNLGQHSLWYDELLQADIVQGPVSQIMPQMARHAAMPLDYFLLNGWVQFGRKELFVRFPALFFGTLAVPLIYLLARQLFNRRVGLLAAALLTWSSFAIQYSRELRPYALLLVLVLVSYIGLWRAYQTQQVRYWAIVFLGLTGAAFTHYFALFMLLPLGLFVAIQQLRHLRVAKFWPQTAAFALCLFLLFATLVLSGRFRFLYNVSFGVASAVTQPEQLTAPSTEKPNRGSGPPLELTFFVDKVLGPLATGNPAGLLLYNGFFLLAVLSLLVRPDKRRPILMLLGWLCLPILLIYLFLLYRGTFYAIRYILYTLPAYLMLVAYGLETIVTFLWQLLSKIRPYPWVDQRSILFKRPIWPSSALALLLILPLLLAKTADLQAYYTADAHEDWRAVGRLLQTYADPADAVIAVRAEPTMNWYYPPATANYGTFHTTSAVWQALNAHPRRWFVLSSYSRRRDKALRDWLGNNGGVMIGIDRRVVLYVQQEGLSAEELLAQVKTFALPQKPLTYATLARQLHEQGDLAGSRAFYERALELADPTLKRIVEAQMAANFASPQTTSEGF